MNYDWTAYAEARTHDIDHLGATLRRALPPELEPTLMHFQNAVSTRGLALDLVWYRTVPMWQRVLWAIRAHRSDQHA